MLVIKVEDIKRIHREKLEKPFYEDKRLTNEQKASFLKTVDYQCKCFDEWIDSLPTLEV